MDILWSAVHAVRNNVNKTRKTRVSKIFVILMIPVFIVCLSLGIAHDMKYYRWIMEWYI